jgi:hypothetical protein
MMPNDVEPAKIKRIATTNIDELRNMFRHARGYLRYHNVNTEEQRRMYWVCGFLEGPLSKWWYSQVAQTGDEIKIEIEIVYNMYRMRRFFTEKPDAPAAVSGPSQLCHTGNL